VIGEGFLEGKLEKRIKQYARTGNYEIEEPKSKRNKQG
jgi:hypothetical protein